jgi:hypothetical protein
LSGARRDPVDGSLDGRSAHLEVLAALGAVVVAMASESAAVVVLGAMDISASGMNLPSASKSDSDVSGDGARVDIFGDGPGSPSSVFPPIHWVKKKGKEKKESKKGKI